MKPDNPLRVQFGDSAALIWCDDLTLRRSLSQYFCHCFGNTAPVVATYQITATKNGELQLRRDEKLLQPIPSLSYVFTYLTRDIVAKLVTRDQQRLVFHAAGLAHGQKGLILCGPPGSGKSTLAAWLTATGFDFLSDEVVAVTLDSREMSGLTCPIVLTRDSAFVWQHWLGENAAQNLTYFLNGTAWLDPELLRPHCVRATAHPQILVFPRYAAGEPFVARPLSAAEAVFRLMHQLVNFKNLPDQGFTAVTRFARQAVAYSLSYADVTTVAAWVEQIV